MHLDQCATYEIQGKSSNSMIDINREFHVMAIEIKQKARAAIANINRRADAILEQLREDHLAVMQQLDKEQEQRDIAAAIKARMHPHDSLEAWWKYLPEEGESEWWIEGRDWWNELYQVYRHEGIRAIGDNNHFAFAVMEFLRKQEDYLRQPSACCAEANGAPEMLCKESPRELPGMWEEADLIGGQTDV